MLRHLYLLEFAPYILKKNSVLVVMPGYTLLHEFTSVCEVREVMVCGLAGGGPIPGRKRNSFLSFALGIGLDEHFVCSSLHVAEGEDPKTPAEDWIFSQRNWNTRPVVMIILVLLLLLIIIMRTYCTAIIIKRSMFQGFNKHSGPKMLHRGTLSASSHRSTQNISCKRAYS